MKKIKSALWVWEVFLVVSLFVYAFDAFLSSGMFYITIPLTFLIGVMACIFAFTEKAYFHAILCGVGILIPVFIFTFFPF